MLGLMRVIDGKVFAKLIKYILQPKFDRCHSFLKRITTILHQLAPSRLLYIDFLAFPVYCNFPPHSMQNFSPSSTSLPQFGQVRPPASIPVSMFERWTTLSFMVVLLILY